MYYRLNENEARDVMESGDVVSSVCGSRFKSHPDVHYIGLAEGECSVHRVYMLSFKSGRWAMFNYLENRWIVECIGYLNDLDYSQPASRSISLLTRISNAKQEITDIVADYKYNQNRFSFLYTGGIHPTVAKLIKDFELHAKLRVRITQKVSCVVGDYETVVGRLPHAHSTYLTFTERYQELLKLKNGELEIYYPKEDRWVGRNGAPNWIRDICSITMREYRIR